MASQHRQERVEELLRSFLASELMMIDEGSVRLITITAVKVSRDLKYATVYWCKTLAQPTEAADSEIEYSLKCLIPSLRKRIAEELELRFVPELDFKFDQTPFMTEKIDALLRKAHT